MKPVNTQQEHIGGETAGKLETWLDTQDVLQRLHISNRTLTRWCANKILPFSQIGKKRFYREADVQAMLKKHIKRG